MIFFSCLHVTVYSIRGINAFQKSMEVIGKITLSERSKTLPLSKVMSVYVDFRIRVELE